MRLYVACPIFLFCLLSMTFHVAQAEEWPGWRGPRGDGTSLERNVPTHWSAKDNIAWKTAVPGVGYASPVVWGERIFTVTALPDGGERVLLCFDRKTGAILWQQTVVRTAREPMHPDNSLASSTPATDGEQVYAAFQDGKDVVAAAYDFSGQRRWLARPGTFSSPHGFCSSPVLYKDKVILNVGNKGDSYTVALSRSDGSTVWKIPHKNGFLSYSVPFIRELAGRDQMIVCADAGVSGYNPNDGARYWVVDGPSDEFVVTPAYNDRAGLLLISSGYPKRHILAIRPDGRGNVTQTHIAWQTTEGAPYVPSPMAEGGYFLTASTSGVTHCFEASSGRIVWKEKLGKQYPSPVSANGLVYILNDDGVTTVIEPGPEFVRVARNEIGEPTRASAAISRGQIFLRGYKHLFCIGNN